MTNFQIGTLEPRGCIGSRAARGDTLAEAVQECRERSMNRAVKEAWVRSVDNGRLGNVLVTFVKGVQA